MKYIDPSEKLFQHMGTLQAIKDGQHPAPVNVEIDLSNRCNLGCQDCHFAHTHSRGPLASRPKPEGMLDVGDLFETDLIGSVLGQMKAFGVQSITWTGGGEPTLHPDFERIIEVAHMLGFVQGIYTNGTMIDAAMGALLKNRMKWVYVSLDRHTSELYRKYKQTNAFAKAIAGIDNLVLAKGPATIGIGFLLDETCWAMGNEMIDLASDLQADYVQFRPAIVPDPKAINRRGPNNIWIKPVKQWIEGVQGRRFGKTLVIADIDRFEQYRNWGGHGYPTCYFSQLQTVITPNAKVWTCVNRRGFDGDCLGDLHVESFESIWSRSKAYQVNDRCRVMCRGHIANQTLNKVMSDVPHKEFI